MPKSRDIEVSRRVLLKAGMWFFLFNTVFVLLLSFRYFSLIPDELITEHPFYLFSLILSHFVFLSFIPFFFLYTPITILTKNKRTSMICAIIGVTLLLFVLIIDSYIFSLYRFHINKFVVEQLLGPDAGQVFELPFVLYLLALLFFSLVIACEIYLFRLAYWVAGKSRMLYLYVICSVLIAFGLFTQIRHAFGEATGNRGVTGLDKYFPLCTPLNANKLLSVLGVKTNNEHIDTDFTGKKYAYPKTMLQTSPTGKNIALIVLDSWHYETLDSITSPNLYRFAQKSSLFTRHYSGSNGTRTAIFSLFFGLPGMYWDDFRDKQTSPIMIDELQKNNYDIKLFPSASLRNPPLDKNVFVTVANQCSATKGLNAWQRDRSLTNNFLSFLRNRNEASKPFFSLLFYDSLHSMIMPESFKPPFTPTWMYPKYESLGKDVDPTRFFNLYKNMVYYLDTIFGELITAMESEGLLENTIIIITGDHGQEFDDNRKNFWGHNGNFSDAQIRTPFIYYSQENEPQVYHHLTSHYDVVPTLMQEVFSTQNPANDYSIGKSLFDSTKREFHLVDSYIAFGIIDTAGTITNIYYDGKYEMLDKKLNPLNEVNINPQLYEKAMELITSFYTE
ncbi:MAG: sulfatase-like hydrolase/transferase [Prevotellaceae bacterium]|jgi:membrane-anchored protein YejM (alkaline phosphatase superfamily)|nr:sulfatase-like hydrolase/transferase [Prevotellaceae bacterium]